jgi:hypothetical protein
MNKPCKFADIMTIFAESVGNKIDADQARAAISRLSGSAGFSSQPKIPVL